MCPSGKTRQVSEFSWGSASARYGRASPCPSTVSSSALKTRTTNATSAPANVTGRLARLVGSTRTTVTSVWFGRELVLAPGASPGGVLGLGGGAHAAETSSASRTTAAREPVRIVPPIRALLEARATPAVWGLRPQARK